MKWEERGVSGKSTGVKAARSKWQSALPHSLCNFEGNQFVGEQRNGNLECRSQLWSECTAELKKREFVS